MAPDRHRPSLDRVRELLRRGEKPDPEWDPDSGPDPERVTEEDERLTERDPPRE